MKHAAISLIIPFSASLLFAGCLIRPQPRAGAYATNPAPAAGPQAGYASPGAARAPAPRGRAAPAPRPAAPTVVSVTLRNSCRSTVKVFYGKKPKYGSGTYSRLSSNSVTSKSFRPGDMIWIVDDNQNGISSATVSAGVRTIEVTKSCTGLTQR